MVCGTMFYFLPQTLQQSITDHEPEFVSLKREIQTLCTETAAESAYLDRAAPLCKDGCPVGCQLPRPGQQEQDNIICDYEQRLEALRRMLTERAVDLASQLEKGKEFEGVTSDLAKWLDGLEAGLEDFKIRDPRSEAIRAQQERCQVRQKRGGSF